MKAGAIGKGVILLISAAAACGCANTGVDLSTASVTPSQPATTAKADPVCVALATQINTIKGDGSIERLEKAAAGKGAKVEVKRATLQKQAELNKANADFMTRCGPTLPAQQAAAPPQTGQAQTASSAPPAASAAAATHAN